MISEGSSDTEDWRNDSRKFCFAITGINYIENIFKLLYFTKFMFLLYFVIINTALVSIRDFKKKI